MVENLPRTLFHPLAPLRLPMAEYNQSHTIQPAVSLAKIYSKANLAGHYLNNRVGKASAQGISFDIATKEKPIWLLTTSAFDR